MALPPSSSASSLSAASAQPTPLHLHLTSRAPGRLPLLHFSRAALPPPLRARIPRTNLPAAPGTPLHRALPPPPSASASSSSSIAGGGFGSDEADDGHNHHGGDGGEGGGDDGGHNDHGDEGGADESPGDARGEALFVLAQLGRKLDTLPSDLAAAIESGRIGGDIVSRFNELEANGFIKWLLQFEGFRERLLADELFLTKLGIECGIGLVAKVTVTSHTLLFLYIYFFSRTCAALVSLSSFYFFFIKMKTNTTPDSSVLYCSDQLRRAV